MKPVGGRIGAFTLHPQLELSAAYDDNVYALENKTDDVVMRASPSLRIEGDMKPYTLVLTGGADIIRYKDNETENREDWRVGVRNKLELAEKTFLTANAGYDYRHEDRGDPNVTSTNRKPAAYSLTTANAGFDRDLAKLRAGIRGSYSKYNYRDATQISGAITNNDDRDREEYLGEARLGYEFSRGYAVIVKAAYGKVDYRLPLDDAGFDRDSKGFRLLGGVLFELSQLLTGEVTAGYFHRSYSDPRFPSTDKFAFTAQLEWFPTELTSLRFTADRSPQETVSANYSSFTSSTYSVRVEHELMRTLKINVTTRYVENDYERGILATTPSKTEKYYGASLGVRYEMNRNLYALIGYDYNKKTSTDTVPGSEFTRNKLGLTIGAKL